MRETNKRIEIIVQAVKSLPASPGVYKMMEEGGKVIYVGKAKNLPKRVISYASPNRLSNRIRRMVKLIVKIDHIVTKSEAEALLLEASLIRALKPKFNILLKDDKSFPYICIENDHPYPRITKFRGKKNLTNTYFGPFAEVYKLYKTIVEMQKMFLIRPCSNSFFASRTRPCLQYQIKRCSAPCVAKISESEYANLITLTKDFLGGKNTLIQEKLKLQMEEASRDQEYEKAAVIRDRIQLLTSIQSNNFFKTDNLVDADIIVGLVNELGCAIEIMYIRDGNNFGSRTFFPAHAEEAKLEEVIEVFIGQIYQQNIPPNRIIINCKLAEKKVLEEALLKLHSVKVNIIRPPDPRTKELIAIMNDKLSNALITKNKQIERDKELLKGVKKLFLLSKLPKRIEVIDNSHIQGSNAVSCIIVAGMEGFIKNEYRKFNIRETKEADDYHMLREVLRRRLSKLSPDKTPDLILIDGGQGHLTTAKAIFEELNIKNIPFVCISKGVDRNAGREYFHQLNKPAIQLRKNDPVLYYLQRLRDEAHRFAIETHRKKRISTTLSSSLSDIEGIGKARQKTLLLHFGSPEAIRSATIQDIMRIKGFSRKVSQKILDFLNKT